MSLAVSPAAALAAFSHRTTYSASPMEAGRLAVRSRTPVSKDAPVFQQPRWCRLPFGSGGEPNLSLGLSCSRTSPKGDPWSVGAIRARHRSPYPLCRIDRARYAVAAAARGGRAAQSEPDATVAGGAGCVDRWRRVDGQGGRRSDRQGPWRTPCWSSAPARSCGCGSTCGVLRRRRRCSRRPRPTTVPCAGGHGRNEHRACAGIRPDVPEQFPFPAYPHARHPQRQFRRRYRDAVPRPSFLAALAGCG